MRELMAARAVISIWTPSSIKTDWVRAEAGRAKSEGKLIPVKSSDITYADIPLPFGEMHTEPLDRMERIAGAVAALLSAPPAQSSMLSRLAASLRLEVLSWVGILAIALSILQGAKGVLTLSEIASWLVERWHDLTVAFWTWPLQFVGITVLEEVVPVLTTALFLVLTAVGIRLRQFLSGAKSEPELPLRMGLLVLILASLPTLLSIFGLVPSFGSTLLQGGIYRYAAGVILSNLFWLICMLPACLLMSFYHPKLSFENISEPHTTWFFRRLVPKYDGEVIKRFDPRLLFFIDRILSIVLAFVIVTISAIVPLWVRGLRHLASLPGSDKGTVDRAVYFVDYVIWATGLVFDVVLVGIVFCFMLASVRELRRRFTFILIGVGILLALNELSKVSWPTLH